MGCEKAYNRPELEQRKFPELLHGMACMRISWCLFVALFPVYISLLAVGRRSPAPASAPAVAPAAPAPSDGLCTVASPSLEKFIEPLTFPPVIDVSHGQRLTLGAYKISQKLHRDLPNTTLYAFGTSQETAVFPGPTLMARRYVPAHVRWENHIPDEHHFLPPTLTIEWANPRRGGVPIVVHLHGAEAPSIYDGNPDAWITAKNETGPAFVTQDYVYTNTQPPMTLFYHDHTIGMTRLNVMAGLSGMYILRPTEEEEAMLGLPEGAPLVFKDWRFFNNGSINKPGPAGFTSPSEWCPEWGDVWLVNGRVWPFVRVFPKPYRFRMLNACNARFTALYFNDSSVPFLQIGTDGGILPEPMPVNDYLFTSPGERVDFIIDFSELDKQTALILHNRPYDPSPIYDPTYIQPQTQVIMKFVVVHEDGLQEGLIEHPDYLEKLTAYMRRTSSWPAVKNKVEVMEPLVREITMVTHVTPEWQGEYTIGDNSTWYDPPVDIEPVVGSFEIWEVLNTRLIPHNLHMHLVQFQVLDQNRVDVQAYRNKECSTKIPYPENGTCFLDYPQSLALYYRGWKDTFILWGETMVRILIHFATREGDHFSFDPTQGPGYVLHCHIHQHEDHTMMRPFRLRYDNTSTY